MPRFLTDKIKYIGEDSTEKELKGQDALGIEDTEHHGIQTKGCNVTVEYANALGEGLKLEQPGNEGAFCVGKYNEDKTGVLFSVGNGTSDYARSNIFEVCADGNIKIYPTAAASLDCTAIIKNYQDFVAEFWDGYDVTVTITEQIGNSTAASVEIEKVAPVFINWGDNGVSLADNRSIVLSHSYPAGFTSKQIKIYGIRFFGPSCLGLTGCTASIQRGRYVREVS